MKLVRKEEVDEMVGEGVRCESRRGREPAAPAPFASGPGWERPARSPAEAAEARCAQDEAHRAAQHACGLTTR